MLHDRSPEYWARQASLDEVARSMHISKKTIYVHYPGKRELYGYIVEQQAALQKAQLKQSVAELPDNRAKVETLVKFVIVRFGRF